MWKPWSSPPIQLPSSEDRERPPCPTLNRIGTAGLVDSNGLTLDHGFFEGLPRWALHTA